MPELNFVLPHWLYWGALVLFPLATFLIYRAGRRKGGEATGLSLPLAYFLWLVGGFLGVHRLYVESRWAVVFVALFITVLFVNVEVREVRDELSGANNQVKLAERLDIVAAG